MTVSGSGKTVLALELVRMLVAARGLRQEDVTVVTGEEGTEELQGWIKGYGGLEGAQYSIERVTKSGRAGLELARQSHGHSRHHRLCQAITSPWPWALAL